MNVMDILRQMSKKECEEALKALQNFNLLGIGTTTPSPEEKYFYLDSALRVDSDEMEEFSVDFERLRNGVSTNENLVADRGKEERLSRRLWKFFLENESASTIWNNADQRKYYILYCKKTPTEWGWVIDYDYVRKLPGITYFSSEELAQRAIDEVCIPFEKEEGDYL